MSLLPSSAPPPHWSSFSSSVSLSTNAETKCRSWREAREDKGRGKRKAGGSDGWTNRNFLSGSYSSISSVFFTTEALAEGGGRQASCFLVCSYLWKRECKRAQARRRCSLARGQCDCENSLLMVKGDLIVRTKAKRGWG
jgi:hypothetical protein